MYTYMYRTCIIYVSYMEMEMEREKETELYEMKAVV